MVDHNTDQDGKSSIDYHSDIMVIYIPIFAVFFDTVNSRISQLNINSMQFNERFAGLLYIILFI